MLIRLRRLASLFLLLSTVSFICSCNRIYLNDFTEPIVKDFKTKALSAEKKYQNEPIAGTVNPFPASFVITGKVLVLDSENDYRIPLKAYQEYSFDKYSWFTENPLEIRYVVLVETVNEWIVYTIVDLSYDEKVYKGIVDSYMELAEILENLTL